MYRLTFLSGTKSGQSLTVNQRDFLIGRDADCHLRLLDATVMGRHALIEERADACLIRLLTAPGEVKVNHQTVTQAQLFNGDEIDIGIDRFLFATSKRLTATRRRRSKFHGLTFLSVATILALQAVVLAGLFLFWYIDPIVDPPPATEPQAVEELEEDEEVAPAPGEPL
jgi:hypothetical protein